MADRYKSTGDTSTPFIKKLKDILKIKRRKNKDYSAKTGTKTPDKRFASFRKGNANKKLQEEAKDPTKNIRTYERVTSKNKDKFSDQHLKKDEKNKKNKTRSGSRTPSGYVRYKGKLVSTRTAQGRKAANRLKAKKRAQEMAKKRLANK